MRVVSVVSTKGGVGKTTVAANLGGLLADAGLRVLLLDLDSQPTLSSYYVLSHEAIAGAYELIALNLTDSAQIICTTTVVGLDLTLSNDDQGRLSTLLLHAPDGRLRLRNLLDNFRPNYDLLLIDTQGARSVLLEMAILACDLAFSPVTPEMLAARELRRGTLKLLSELEPFRHQGIPPAHHRSAIPTGRPSYDPVDLLKLYLYGYFQRIRSSRRLEAECQRNIQVMWLLGRLAPDFKTIADFRRDNSAAFTATCRAFVRFCRNAGLIAIAGKADRNEGGELINRSAVQMALRELQIKKANNQTCQGLMEAQGLVQHIVGESDAQKMRTPSGKFMAYNIQSAVDAEHGLILHHEVTQDSANRQQLEPMAKAAKAELNQSQLSVTAYAGYSNGEQFQPSGSSCGAYPMRRRN